MMKIDYCVLGMKSADKCINLFNLLRCENSEHFHSVHGTPTHMHALRLAANTIKSNRIRTVQIARNPSKNQLLNVK